MSTLGQQLKQLRNNKKLSQPEFAEQVGIEQSYLSKLENDKSIPSNDIFRSLLLALDMSIDEFMKPLAASHDKARLIQITDVEQWLKKQAVNTSAKQRTLIYLVMFLISFGCALFYVGHKNYVFNERFYEYRSIGIIKADEPLNVFNHWKNYIIDPSAEKRTEKLKEMLARRVELFKLMDEYIGESFVEEVAGGKRVYTTDAIPRFISHAGNSWLEFIGLFAVVFGLALALFEPKLTRHP
ncbi:helix-turn-helix transcriptional regulator [Pseudoalteromonas sp. SG45-5]|uniref:helix-turn-helix domain-containing protein n=1 Tax=unclassified Pseudoalteromonas TaxID=194690 RepID=UPI0015FB3F61|nr:MULTISPECIES: helix-turn-helix transcriptional regulator [unclassified Pseudoalteromonas]MBB1386478.1 helix-turn-helix transcriptional regulator [Pseudoalteromonas sp. SG45-5]MBB1394518.1 helix-turn-helix transcriptional regulator [Pseudoalteromonas sp. SG44-4]MBB1449014.1 helix-turn-helix transcriptional regulator [Pseudoalteromonas sp. SG41-6]